MANINRLASSMGMGSKVDYGDGCCPPICSSEKSPAYTSCMQIVDAHLEPPLARPMIRSGSRDRNCPKRDAFFMVVMMMTTKTTKLDGQCNDTWTWTGTVQVHT